MASSHGCEACKTHTFGPVSIALGAGKEPAHASLTTWVSFGYLWYLSRRSSSPQSSAYQERESRSIALRLPQDVCVRIHGLLFKEFATCVDFYLLYLPLPIVWKLQMDRKRKLGVIAIFLTGLM